MSPAATTDVAPRGGGGRDGSGVPTAGSSGCRPPATIAAKSRTAPRSATTVRAMIPVRRPSCTQRWWSLSRSRHNLPGLDRGSTRSQPRW